MSPVRSFRSSDLEAVAGLHWRSFSRGRGPAPNALQTYFAEIFLKSPWQDPERASLVYENGRGHIVGFLGVIPRPMEMDGKAITATLDTQFMVDPEAGGLVAFELVRQLFHGSQDVAFSDENHDKTKAVWERLGGKSVPILSLRWTRILRPGHFIAATAARRLSRKWIARPLTVAGRLIDRALIMLAEQRIRPSPSPLLAEELTASTWLTLECELTKSYRLKMSYTPERARWLLSHAADKRCHGRLTGAALRDAAGRVVGWYLYYVKRGSTAQVLTIGARDRAAGQVLDHLFDDAWRRGAMAVSGRMEPAYLKDLTDRQCLINRGFAWTCVHARRPDIVQAFCRGQVRLTRLDGEWWMRFQEVCAP